MLFYGILMTHLMIFLTSYFLSFAILASIFTAFLTPNSSRIVIYFSLLLILFLSTLIAYGLTRLVNVSIFFIGACIIIVLYSFWIRRRSFSQLHLLQDFRCLFCMVPSFLLNHTHDTLRIADF